MCKNNNPPTVQGEGEDYSAYLWARALGVDSGKPSRELHKQLKKHFGKKSGLPLYKRYPNMPLALSIIVMLLSLVALIIKLYYS